MHCTIGEEGLRCSFPERQSVDIVFNSLDGSQRRVVSCSQHGESSICDIEEGFGTYLKDPNQVLVTVPDTLKGNGIFSCQKPGGSGVVCQWYAKDKITSDYSTKGPPEAQDIWAAITAIALVVIAVIAVIALLFVIYMYKRKRIRRKLHLLRLLLGSAGAAQDTEPQLLRIMAYPWMLTDRQLNNAKKKLLPEQAELLEKSPARVFLHGKPGSGKTTVLLLQAIKWLQDGHDVHIVSDPCNSLAVCTMLYNVLLQNIQELTPNTSPKPQPYHHTYDLQYPEDVEEAVNSLSGRAKGHSLYIIFDNVVKHQFCQTFYSKLLERVPGLHLWAAGEDNPFVSEVEKRFEQCLRPPPTIMKEIQQTEKISEEQATKESSRLLNPNPTYSSPVRRVCHQGQDHSGKSLADCSACGEEVAKILHGLKDSDESIQWRDVLMLHLATIKDNSATLEALRKAEIPVRVMKQYDIDDVATARSDVVWVADQNRIQGLERRVVVCLANAEPQSQVLLNKMFSVCSEVLVIVNKPP